MENILINIAANTIEVFRASNNELLHKIVNITSLYSKKDLEILLKYEESTLTLKYINIIGVSVNGGVSAAPTSFSGLLNQLQTIVVILPSTSSGSSGGDASSANQLLGNTSLTSINTKLTSQATVLKQDITNNKLDLIKSVLDNTLTELQSQQDFEQNIFYDKTNITKFYKVRDILNQDTGLIVTTILNIDSTPANPLPLTDNLVQVITSVDYEFNTIQKKAIVSGIGYIVEDRIQELQILNMSLATLVNTIWVNKTTNLLIAPPVFSHLVIDDTYANTANQLAGNTTLNSIDTKLNSQATSVLQNAQNLNLDNILLEKRKDLEINYIPLRNKSTRVVILEKRTRNIFTGFETISHFDVNSQIPLVGVIATDYNIDNDLIIDSTSTLGYDTVTGIPYSQIVIRTVDSLNNIISINTLSVNSEGNTFTGVPSTFVLGEYGKATENKQNAQLLELEAINAKLNDTVNVNVVNQVSSNVEGASEATQLLIKTSVNNLDFKTPSIGQSTVAGSSPVVLPISQIATLTPPAAITGFSLETTQNAINLKTPSLGQALAANSVPIVLTAAQVTTLTPQTNSLTDVQLRATPLLTNQTLATAEFSKITDGINVAKILPASTSPLPTDNGLVTAISPNGNTIKIGESIFINSLSNTSTAQLGAGVAFIGGIVTLLTGKSLIISVNSDQPYTVNIAQYNNLAGTQSLGTTTFTRTANISFNESIQINGDYARVSVLNTGSLTTTTFFVNTYFGDMSPFPTSVTNIGNFKTSIEEVRTGLNIPINYNQIAGLPINVNTGLATNGTQRFISANRVENQVGAINTATEVGLIAAQRIKNLTFTNNTASTIFVQIHNKASALVLNDIPLNGLIWRVPANATLNEGAGYFGEAGVLFSATTRLGFSTTFATFTPITPANTSYNVITTP